MRRGRAQRGAARANEANWREPIGIERARLSHQWHDRCKPWIKELSQFSSIADMDGVAFLDTGRSNLRAENLSQDRISLHFQSSLDGLTRAVQNPDLLARLHAIARAIGTALTSGKKLLLIGNGGSAADAQHIAAEIIGRYKRERPAWPAIALTTDTSALTAISNDYSYQEVFARQVQGLGHPGDVLLGLTTSGKSPNILTALKVARESGLITVGFTGAKGESMRPFCDHILIAPTEDTPVIQQIHLMAAHGICDQVEYMLTTKTSKS